MTSQLIAMENSVTIRAEALQFRQACPCPTIHVGYSHCVVLHFGAGISEWITQLILIKARLGG